MPGANDYLIPFGINSKPFFEELNKMESGTDATVSNINDANKAMQKGFIDAAGAGEKLGSTILSNAQKAATLDAQAKVLGKDIGDALSGKNVGSGLEEKVKKFTSVMVSFSKAAKEPIKFNIESAKLSQFVNILQEGASDLKILQTVIEATKTSLAGMDPNSTEFAELNTQLQTAETFLKALADAGGGAETKTKSLKLQLRELKAAMSEMELAGKEDTAEFFNMAVAAGKVEDQIGDTSARVRVLASDTKFLDAGIQAVTALAGAFTAAQGAAALFGGENEEVQKVIQKVTGAMAVLQGIQAVAAALNKTSALSVLFLSGAQVSATVSTTALATAEGVQAGATVAATTATRAFTAALLANPITAILVGIAALVTALIAFSSGSDDAEEATKRLNDALERQDLLLQLDEASLKRRTDLLLAQAKTDGAIAKSRAKNDAERAKIEQETSDKINIIQTNSLNDQRKLQETALFETRHQIDKENEIRRISDEDFKKLLDKELKQEQTVKDIKNQIRISELEGQKDAADKEAEITKAAIEQAKKDAEERKKILEQQVKFTAELEKGRIDGLKEGADKERAQATQETQSRIAELQAEKSLSVQAEKDKQAIIKQLRLNLANQIAGINKKEAQDTATVQLKAAQLTIQYREEGIVKEIETIRLGFEEKKREIAEQFKDDADTRKRLTDQLNDEQIRQQKAAQDAFTNKAIQAESDRAVLEVETARKFLPDLPGIEEQKQVAILEVKLKFAEKALQALLDQGNAENSTAVLQAKKQVQDLQKQLGVAVDDAANSTPTIDWFKLLGLGDMSDGQRKAIVEAAQKGLDSIRQITDFVVGQYQRQIDKKQEVIDQIDDDISDLEDQLDREKELREKGFANNVDIIQAELDAKKKAKEDELKQQAEIQQKQQAVQKAQLILDTAVQASNLVTSATAIFKSLAGIPFVGIPLAIGIIALMTGAFITAKVKAFQAVSDQKQSLGEGGYVDGKPHSQGGRKYRAVDGSGVVELEGGEHVTNKKSTDKYADLLDAINSDDLASMNEDALRDMLQGMGIVLSSEQPKQVIKIVRERDEFKHAALMAEGPGSDISGDVKSINDNVSYLAARERERVERWEDDQYYYEKAGNKTTKIRK